MKKYLMTGIVFLMLAGAIAINAKNSAVVLQPYGEAETTAKEAPETGEEKAEVNETELSEGDYFSDFRQDRDAVRNEELGYLDEVIAVSATDAETLLDAQNRKLSLIENMEKEFTIEALITAKGFPEAAVLFHGGSVNVVVDAESLSETQVAQILDIVQRETGESASSIRIIER